MSALLSLVPWWERLAAILALCAALFGYGWLKGAEHEEHNFDAYKLAEAKQSLALQTAAAAKTLSLQRTKDEAVDAAAQREKKLRADLAAARATGNGLRDDLAAARSELSSASITSLRAYTATLGTVFGECTAEVERLAGAAQGHAADTLTFEQAWPK